MTTQPIQGIRFIHTAIKRGVAAIEADAGELAHAADACLLIERVRFLAHEVHMHTSGEEEAIYSRLDQRAPNMGMHYLFDHDEEEGLFRALDELLANWSPSPAHAAEVRRAATRLRYHATLHITKEDEVVVPMIMKHFAVEEQAEMIQRAVGRYAPTQLAKTFPWIVREQTPEDRVAFIVDDLMRLMPPDVFGAVKGWIADGIPRDDWADIVRRAPQLGG